MSSFGKRAAAATAIAAAAVGGVSAAPTATAQIPPAPASPCVAYAKACIDINAGKAWLQDGNGHSVYGPVPISSGMAGLDTPRGIQTVSRKVENEWSGPYNGPMPFSVYFGPGGNDNGVAIHEGDPAIPSHGCVHVPPGDAQQFFNHLQVGDTVHVF